MAHPPHRIDRPKLLLLIEICPVFGVIMNEDRNGACRSEVYMMGESIIVEAHLGCGLLQFTLQPRLIVGA